MNVIKDVGSYRKLPHYSIKGNSTQFYVWVNLDGHGTASGWFSGAKAFRAWGVLQRLRIKDKKQFVGTLLKIHKEGL